MHRAHAEMESTQGELNTTAPVSAPSVAAHLLAAPSHQRGHG